MNNLKSSKLKELRSAVEAIDLQIISLLVKRFKNTAEIQKLKRGLKIPISQKKREADLLKRYEKRAMRGKLPVALLRKLFTLLFAYSKESGIIK